MANHRALAQFSRAKWRLMVLLPFWLLQLSLTTAMVGLFAWRLSDTMKTYDEQDKKGGLPTIEVAWEGTNIALAFVATIGTIYEIVKYFAETLTPWTMLFTHCIKMSCASAILALDAVVYVQRHDRHYSLVGLALDGAFIITACVLALYSVLTYRRLSVYDDYAHPVNVKPYGMHDSMDRDLSYSSKLAMRSSTDKQFSSQSSRISIGSASIKTETASTPSIERRPSQYNHERDTQFESYIARRGSISNKSDVERALSPPLEEQARRDSLNSVVVKNRSRGASYSEHVLGAVPEEEDEFHDATDKESKEALLGDGQRESVEGRPAVPQEVDMAEPKWQRK